MTPAPETGRSPARRRQKGYSLLEILVAFAIMAFALGALYRASGGSVGALGETGRQQRAAVLAESLLALRDSVPAEGWQEAGESAGFSWRIGSEPYATGLNGPDIPPLHRVTVDVGWRDEGRERRISLVSLLPQRRPPKGGAL